MEQRGLWQRGRLGGDFSTGLTLLPSGTSLLLFCPTVHLPSFILGYLILVQEAVNHVEEMEMVSSTSPPEKTKHKLAPPSNHQLVVPATSNQCVNSTLQSPLNSPVKAEKNGHAKDNPKTAKVFEIQSMPNGKTRTSLKTMSRRKLSQQKEKKATQMLAIVLGKTLVCLPLSSVNGHWLPWPGLLMGMSGIGHDFL